SGSHVDEPARLDEDGSLVRRRGLKQDCDYQRKIICSHYRIVPHVSYANRYVLLSFEFFARRDDLWGSRLGGGPPLRPACPRAGICEGCEHAGLGGRRSPRGCPTNRRVAMAPTA